MERIMDTHMFINIGLERPNCECEGTRPHPATEEQ